MAEEERKHNNQGRTKFEIVDENGDIDTIYLSCMSKNAVILHRRGIILRLRKQKAMGEFIDMTDEDIDTLEQEFLAEESLLS